MHASLITGLSVSVTEALSSAMACQVAWEWKQARWRTYPEVALGDRVQLRKGLPAQVSAQQVAQAELG